MSQEDSVDALRCGGPGDAEAVNIQSKLLEHGVLAPDSFKKSCPGKGLGGGCSGRGCKASVKAQVCDYCVVLAATSPRCVVNVAIGVGLLSLRIGLWQRCENEVDLAPLRALAVEAACVGVPLTCKRRPGTTMQYCSELAAGGRPGLQLLPSDESGELITVHPGS